MIETFGRLRDATGQDTAWRASETALRDRRDELVIGDNDLRACCDAIATTLSAAIARVDAWPSLKVHFDTLDPGRKRTCRRGSKAIEKVRTETRPERFHELRKRIKYHRYHVRLLRRAWPGVMESYARTLKQPGSQLGDADDLSVLLDILEREPVLMMAVQDRPHLLMAIHQERERLRDEAVITAASIYAEKPKFLGARLRCCWEVCKSG